ncbi:MAG: FtsQ-type POTRA domain-containing protein [Candidatus Acidiferrales bacterium]
MDADAYHQEVLSEEEPKYLRRQKPVEIRRRKFGKKAWKTYLRVSVMIVASVAAAGALYAMGNFLLTSPEMSLTHPDQIALTGNHFVSRPSVLEVFAADRGRSVLRVPLDARRKQLESLPWVERATVRRALPNHLQVEIVERVPIAFLRDDSDLSLIDVHGVILDKPVSGNFHFPVVTGIHPGLPADERERRMQLFSGFLQQINAARSAAADHVSEVDLSDARNLRATFSGLPGFSASSSANDGPLVVYFGDRDFQTKFQTLLDQIGQWRVTAGRVELVDLRFNGEVVVNPDTSFVPPKPAPAQQQDAKTKVSPPLVVQRPPKRAVKHSK